MEPKIVVPPSVMRREWWAGGIMIGLGIAVVIGGNLYQVGSLSRMGPGLFPIILGVLLALMGVLIIVTAKTLPPDEEGDEMGPPEWRGWACILGGLVAFMILGRYGGLVPATFALVFIAAMGDREHNWRTALLLALGVTVVGCAIFSWGLQLQFPLLRWG
ncbi:Tricarboxylate transport protein TctB [plant metagenome]|uniref:Tricarboxylate transport protein TctB n=2 Tax=plant metagenome TaxID=1297885 RepID=A0A484YA02_9ZZZZ